MKIATIYCATNTNNGKKYIGFDSYYPSRIFAHKKSAYDPKSNHYTSYFHRAIRKHGFEAFSWEILYQSKDFQHCLGIMENHFITEHNTFVGFKNSNGYNMTLGGNGALGRKDSKETRKKKSLALKGRKPDQKVYDANYTPEIRKLLSVNASKRFKNQVPWNKGGKMIQTHCIHCDRYIDNGNYKRWHGNKCKFKSN